jgi:DNA-binding NtrC family response regulator
VIGVILPTRENEMTNRTPMPLYVDHDIDERILVAAILEARGFSIRTAKSAFNAMELVSIQSSDVVIVVYFLPDMTDAQLAQEIRAVEPSARAILLSGRPHLPGGEMAYVDVYIVKDLLLDTTIETIRDLLRSPKLIPEPAAWDRSSSMRSCSGSPV